MSPKKIVAQPVETGSDEEYLQFAAPVASTGDLAQLTSLAEAQAKAEAEVKRIEAELATAREHLNDISERQVPNLMDEIGMTEFKTSTGLMISVKETLRASIPKAKEPEAFAWLRAHGHGALIKRSVIVQFSVGEDETATQLVQEIAGKGLEADDKSSVNSQTLAAFVREKMREGEEIPQELLGVHRQRVSQIKF